jgi:hypothetical protein
VVLRLRWPCDRCDRAVGQVAVLVSSLGLISDSCETGDFRAAPPGQLQPNVQPDVRMATGGPGDRRGGPAFHDLRHSGNTFAASSGAALRDLMARMGHDSERAAMIYQHEARGADRATTDAIDNHVQRGHADDDGLSGALVPAG